MDSGQKLTNAKLAIEQVFFLLSFESLLTLKVIKSLHNDDIFHLVCYDTEVYVTIEGASLSDTSLDMEGTVRGIVSGSRTNLWGGLEKGAELLKKHQKSGYKSRLFLFSDGLVNEGISDTTKILRNVSDLYENGTQVSAFGLGDDFDEKLMKGIADKGVGAYFFIENSEAIPSFVKFALGSLQSMVGSNAVLKVRGTGCGCAKKFYGDYDLVKGANLGDLKADNTRSVLLDLEVLATDKSEEQVFECELVYCREEINYSVKQTLTVCFSTDEKEMKNSKDPEVVVLLALQEIVEVTKNLAEVENNEKAIALQEKQINILKEVVEIDETLLQNQNKIRILLTKAEKDLTKLKQEGISKVTQKEAHHASYTMRRG
jgi:Ca-activated chloride channel family protein